MLIYVVRMAMNPCIPAGLFVTCLLVKEWEYKYLIITQKGCSIAGVQM